VRVRLFALPQIGRGEFARRRLLSDYAEIGRLWNTRLDGLIVSGMEPGPGALREEPYWRMFTELIDWADRQTTSSIWSCLAAHAVVLHRDGIERRPLAAKCFGVYEFTKETDHPLLAGARVQSVDVLGDQRDYATLRFEFHQRGVRTIRLRAGDDRPPDEAAHPVAGAHRRIADKSLIRDRGAALPQSVWTTVVGNSRRGADAGAGKYEDAAVRGKPLAQSRTGFDIGVGKRNRGDHPAC